jgi:hypothetical protein
MVSRNSECLTENSKNFGIHVAFEKLYGFHGYTNSIKSLA